jgi:hypothetical protein
MSRTTMKSVGRPLTAAGLLVSLAASLSACATVACPAMKIADHFSISATSATHLHPSLSLCESAICTPPLNASSKDRGATVASTPALAVYATSTDHWRVAVLDDGDGENGTDPKMLSVTLYDGGTRLASRSITPSWHPASGACSNYNTAPAVRIDLP